MLLQVLQLQTQCSLAAWAHAHMLVAQPFVAGGVHTRARCRRWAHLMQSAGDVRACACMHRHVHACGGRRLELSWLLVLCDWFACGEQLAWL